MAAARRVLASAALLAVALSVVTGCASPTTASAGAPTDARSASVTRSLAAIESEHRTRLGVTAIDTGSGRTVGYRASERFAFASTNKTFIAAATLKASSDDDLDAIVRYSSADLLEYAPITSRFVDTGMTVRELLDAMLRFSDNTAANLLVARLGGPPAVQAFLARIGDRTTRVDRIEPDLNEAAEGDPRDTTTPRQYAADLRKVILGDALEVGDRTLLRDLMLANTTGAATASRRRGRSPTRPAPPSAGCGTTSGSSTRSVARRSWWSC